MKKYYTRMVARQTGRTGRMIKDAAHLARMGNTVFVLCSESNIHHIQRSMFESSHGNCATEPGPFKFHTVQSLGMQNIDWKNQTLTGAPFKTELVIDHRVWEEQFGFAVNGYHEYDDFNSLERENRYAKENLLAADLLNIEIIDLKI